MLEVIRPGLLTTVQDAGRRGWMRYGVPPSGPMDAAAFAVANRLAGNPPDAAGLEITLTGPVIRFHRATMVAVCGAAFDLWVDTLPVPTWHAVFVRAGSHLRFGSRHQGARAYLAVAGGITPPTFLGSRSTYLKGAFGGLEGRTLRRGDRLPVGTHALTDLAAYAGRAWPSEHRPAYTRSPILRLVPQFQGLPPAALDRLCAHRFAVTPASDRMGARLAGPALPQREGGPTISDGVVTGSIQVPPDGQPIVMMADHQTTGGYPKIGTVVQADIPLLAQCVPGDRVRFRAVTRPEAQTLYRSWHAAYFAPGADSGA
jgi:antagonist of KipI